MARYKFICRNCRFDCISRIGKEVGLHSDKLPMVCKHCKKIDLYTVAHPGGIQHSINKPPVCAGCHSSEYLHEWDGLTCPKCNKYMRALGGDIDAEKPFRYW